MGCVHRHRAVPQGQPRHRAHLARGRGERGRAPAHGGSRIGSAAALVARRPHRRLRIHARERRAAVGASDCRRRGAARDESGRRRVRSAVAPRRHGAHRHERHQVARATGIDRRNDDFPTDARLWTGLLWRHWDDWRAGKRQHLFTVTLADGNTRDVTPVDHDVPTIATGGDGDVSVSPDGKEIAVALHGDSTVADNTNVDVYVMGPDGSGMRALTTGRGADNTPRYSPDGKWLAYLSMERAGFEADRQRLMLVGRSDGRTGGPSVEATKGWTLSVGSYIWCPDSKCVYAVVEERGRDNIYRIDLPSFRRSLALGGGGVNTDVQVMPDGRGLLYLHQSNTQPNEIWLAGRQLTHHTDAALEALDLRPLDEFGFVGALGDSVFGWLLKPPGFDPARRYPLIYLIHGGPQGAWTDYWGARWNYALFASRGYVVAAVNFHGSTGYGQKFTDAISQHWGDYPYQDLMKGLDLLDRLPYVDSTRM